MAALRDCMPMTSWLVLTMYFCFFCLTCRYVIEGPGGKIFSIISFIIGGTVIAMDTGESTAGGIICLLGVLNLASHRPYFGRKVAPRYVTSFFSTDLEYDRRKLFFASILLAVPVVLFCRFLFGMESLWLMAVCAFLSVFCMRDILLHWVDPFCIHGKESRTVTLRDYQTRRMRGRHYRHVNMHFFWFKESGPYVADAWRQRLFVDHIGSKYQCVTGKGLFGTEYIVRVQMVEDRGIQSPEPMGYGKGWRLTRQMYSNYFMLPFLLMGILLIILPVMELVVLSAVEVSFPPDYLLFYAGLPFLLGVMSLFLGLWVRRRQSRNLVHLGTGREKTFLQWEQIMPELQELTEGEKARIYDEVVWKIRILVLVVLILLAGILLLALPAAWKWFVGVYFPLLRYIVDSAAGMPDLYSGYGVRLFASSLSLPAMFFILHLVVKKIFLRSFLYTAWKHVKNKT